MKRSVPENLFELEPLEQRILLSGDSLLGALPTGLADKPEDPFAADLALLPSEEVPLSEGDSVQETSSLYSDPYNPADKIDDLFAGLTEENLFDKMSDEDTPEEALDPESVTDESPQGVLENCEITPEEGAAIEQGMEALADFGRHLGDFDDFGAVLPITKDASFGELVGFYEVLDTRLKTPVFDYFNDATDPPTTDGLVAALQDIPSTPDLSVAIDALSGGYDSVSDELRFSLNYTATRRGVVCAEISPEATAEVYTFAEPTNVEYLAVITLDFSFGIDFQDNAGEFFLAVDQFVAELAITIVGADSSDTGETPQNSVDAPNNTVDLDGQVCVRFTETIAGDGRITLSELHSITPETIEDCILLSPEGNLFAQLPAEDDTGADLADQNDPATGGVSRDDLLTGASTNPSLAADIGTLKDSILDLFKELRGVGESITDSEDLNVPLPVINASINDLIADNHDVGLGNFFDFYTPALEYFTLLEVFNFNINEYSPTIGGPGGIDTPDFDINDAGHKLKVKNLIEEEHNLSLSPDWDISLYLPEIWSIFNPDFQINEYLPKFQVLLGLPYIPKMDDIRSDIKSYFGSCPSLKGLLDYIRTTTVEHLSAGFQGRGSIEPFRLIGEYFPEANTVQLDLLFDATREIDLTVNLDNLLANQLSDLGISFDTDMAFTLRLGLKIDFSASISAEDASLTMREASVTIRVNEELSSLGIAPEDSASANPAIPEGRFDFDARVELVFHGLDPPGSTNLTFSDLLTAPDLNSLVDIQTSGHLSVELPVTSEDHPQPILIIYVTSDNVFDPTHLNVTVELVLGSDDPSQTIGIGNDTACDLYLDQAILDLLHKFDKVTIGGPDGSHLVKLGSSPSNAITFSNLLVISTPNDGGEVHITGDIIVTDNSSLTISGSGHTTTIGGGNINITPPGTVTGNPNAALNGDITTVSAAGDLTISDAIIVNGKVVLEAGGNIIIKNPGTIKGNGDGTPDILTLRAPNGSVAIEGAIGGGGLQDVDVESGLGITFDREPLFLYQPDCGPIASDEVLTILEDWATEQFTTAGWLKSFLFEDYSADSPAWNDAFALYRAFLDSTPTQPRPTLRFEDGTPLAEAFKKDPKTERVLKQIMDLAEFQISRISDADLKASYELSDLIHPSTANALDYSGLYSGPSDRITVAELLAGGVGSSNFGPDERQVEGEVVIDKSSGAFKLSFKLKVTIFDVIDFCPGALGGETAQTLTKALRALEAAGRAFDRPFEVMFTYTETREFLPQEPADPLSFELGFVKDMLTDVDLTGVTIIVPEAVLVGQPNSESLRSLAEAIRQQADNSNGPSADAWLIDYDTNGRGGINPFQSILPTYADPKRQGEAVLLFEWSEVESSGQGRAVWAEAAGQGLFSALAELGLIDINSPERNIPLHFIGHGTGSMVVSETVERLGYFDIHVDHVTYLDPHDFKQPNLLSDQLFARGQLGPPDLLYDYGVAVWDNVGFADVYYQTRGLNGTSNPAPEGRPIPGAYNVWLDGEGELPAAGSIPYQSSDGSGDHAYVWNGFYLATVTGSSKTGYAFSRIVGGNRPTHPIFYSSVGGNLMTADQHHKHSSPELVDVVTGLPNTEGLDKLSLTEQIVTSGHWLSSWDPLAIVNGNFDATPADEARIVPGWVDYAGAGQGIVKRESEDLNQLLELNNSHPNRASNWVYVPHDATHLQFALDIDKANSDDVLRVKLDDRLIESAIPLDQLQFDGIVELLLEPSLNGKITTLEFEVFDELEPKNSTTYLGLPEATLSKIGAQVAIDDIKFIEAVRPLSAVGNGDFERQPTTGAIPFWSDGSGLLQVEGKEHFLHLDSQHPSRTHDVFIVPSEAAYLEFDLRRKMASTDDLLKISLSDQVLGVISLADTEIEDADDDGFEDFLKDVVLPIDVELRNQAHRLTFELIDTGGIFSGVDSAVDIDNVAFEIEFFGRTGDVLDIELQKAFGGSNFTLNVQFELVTFREAPLFDDLSVPLVDPLNGNQFFVDASVDFELLPQDDSGDRLLFDQKANTDIANLVFKDRGAPGDPFAVEGSFYFVPDLDTPGNSLGFMAGQFVADASTTRLTAARPTSDTGELDADAQVSLLVGDKILNLIVTFGKKEGHSINDLVNDFELAIKGAEEKAGIERTVFVDLIPKVIDGKLDVNNDGKVDDTDDGTVTGFKIINGGVDVNNDGKVDDNDDDEQHGISIKNGKIDVNNDGVVNNDDDIGHKLQLYTKTKVTLGVFYADDLKGFQGLLKGEVKIDGDSESTYFLIRIEPGYSTEGPNVVDDIPIRDPDTNEPGDQRTLKILKAQQRLKYLNFPGKSGKQLTVDGITGQNTQWAIGLFNNAVNNKPHSPDYTFDEKGLKFINAANAPRWELIDYAGIYDTKNAKHDADRDHRYGTSWSLEVLVGASSIYQPSNSYKLVTDISTETGGYHKPHSTHQAGMDMDIDEPNTTDGSRPWFDVDADGRVIAIGKDTDGTEYDGRLIRKTDVRIDLEEIKNIGKEGVDPIFAVRKVNDPIPTGWKDVLATELLDKENRQWIGGDKVNLSLVAAYKTVELKLRAGYKREVVAQLFNSLFMARTPSGASVSRILWNDPYFFLDDIENELKIVDGKWFFDLNGDGSRNAGEPLSAGSEISKRVQYVPGHEGHFHVDIAAPTEPRPILPTQQEALRQGLEKTQVVVNNIMHEFLKQISHWKLPVVNISVADIYPFSTTLQEALVDPISNYLDSGGPTIAGLVDILREEGSFDYVNGYLSHDESFLKFDLGYQTTRTAENLHIDFGSVAENIGLTFDVSATLDLTASANFDFSFGLDLTPGLPIEDAFFITVDDLTFDVDVHAPDINVGANLGGVAAQISNGKFDLDAQLNIEFVDPNEDGRITLSELLHTGFDSLVHVNASGPLETILPLEAQLGSFATADFGIPTIILRSENVFQTTPDIVIDVRINRDMRDAIIKILNDLDTRVTNVLGGVDSVLNKKLPGINKSLNDLFNIGDLSELFKVGEVVRSYLGEVGDNTYSFTGDDFPSVCGLLDTVNSSLLNRSSQPFDLDRPDSAGRNFAGQDASGLDLRGFDLRGANLRDVNFRGANLQGVDMSGADLTGAILADANLRDTNFTGANLEGADVSKAFALGASLKSIKLNGQTKVYGLLFDGRTVWVDGESNTSGVIEDFTPIDFVPSLAWEGQPRLFSPFAIDKDFTEYDFSGFDLSGLDLSAFNLSEVSLNQANLRNTILEGADLTGTNLASVLAVGTDFTSAIADASTNISDLLYDATTILAESFSDITVAKELTEGVDLSRLDMRGFDLSGLDLSGISFAGLDLRGVNLREAFYVDLRNVASLAGTNLRAAQFAPATLTNKDFLKGLDLRYANLSGLDLSGFDLREVDLRGALLKGSNLSGTDLGGALLQGADLSGVILDGDTNMAGSFVDDETTGYDFVSAKAIDVTPPNGGGTASEGSAVRFNGGLNPLHKTLQFNLMVETSHVFDLGFDFDTASLGIEFADIGLAVNGTSGLTVAVGLGLDMFFGIALDSLGSLSTPTNNDIYCGVNSLQASAGVSVAGLDLPGALYGNTAGVVDGVMTLDLSVGLDFNDPTPDDFGITLAEISNAGVEVKPTGSFYATLPLNVKIDDDFDLSEWVIPVVDIRADDLIAPDLTLNTPGVNVEVRLAEPLKDKIVDFLMGLDHTIDSILEHGQGFLEQNIPVFGKTVDELFGIKTFLNRFKVGSKASDYFDQFTFRGNDFPTLKGILSEINKGMQDSSFTGNLDLKNLILEFGPAVDIDEGVDVSFDFDSSGLEGLDPLLDFGWFSFGLDINGQGSVEGNVALDLDLDFGVDFASIKTLSLEDLIYVRVDEIGIEGKASVNPLDLNASVKADVDVDFLGLHLEDINVLSAAITNGSGEVSAGLEIKVEDGGIIRLEDLEKITAVAWANLNAKLPVAFQAGDEELFGDDFVNADTIIQVQGGYSTADGFPVEVVISNLDYFRRFGFLSLLNCADFVKGGVDAILEKVQEIFQGNIFGIQLPFIGDSLKNAANFVEILREKAENGLNELFAQGEKAALSLLREFLFEALDGFLRDRNGDGSVTADDIEIIVDRDNNDYIKFILPLGGECGDKVPLDFDASVPGLGLEATGDIDLELAYGFDFGFGFSLSKGFFLDTSDDNEVNLTLRANLAKGTSLTATLGFLDLEITDNGIDWTGLLDPSEPNFSDIGSGIVGTFAVDLRDPGEGENADNMLTFNDAWNIKEMFDAELNLRAEASLHAVLSIGGNTGFPSVFTDFHFLQNFVQSFGSIDTDDYTTVGDKPVIEFLDVSLDLGSFISDFAEPILETVQTVTKPFGPIIEILTTPIPIISDLKRKDTTLLDLAEQFGGDYFDRGFVDAVIKIIDVVNSIPRGTESLVINFGDYQISGPDAGDEGVDLRTDDISDPALEPTASDINVNKTVEKAAEAGASPDTLNFLTKFLSIEGLDVPLLESPSTIFNLLRGETVDLFIYEMPKLVLQFEYIQSFPIFPGLNARLGGRVGAEINLGFGFDTIGVKQFSQTKQVSDIFFNGFFLTDHIDPSLSEPDVDELTLFAEIFAGASLGISGIVEAGADGGIFAEIGFDLHDIPCRPPSPT